jgi:predicted amidohydrolase YtcJ
MIVKRALVLVAFALLRAQAPPPDIILVNGHVITVDARFSIAQAIAIKDGRFTASGSNADIRKLAGPGTTTIDLHGDTVIPGLADGHLHDAGGGPGVSISLVRDRWPTCSLQSGHACSTAVPATSS